ncbi:MAG: purine-nucleoside phosphorylase [Spirochaetales bacterium]
MDQQTSLAVDKALAYLKSRFSAVPSIGIVLGSGLSGIGDAFPGESIPYSDIPGFPQPTVSGHRGILKVGPKAIIFLGRFHFYEGNSMSTVVFPVLLMKKWGVKTVVLTNAAGGVNPSYVPGQLVLISDHINFMGTNPFIGPHDAALGPRFFDMTTTYTPALRKRVQGIARSKLGGELAEGVYMGFTGPCYETPAEVRMAGLLGASLVGMSTVPEAITARSCGLDLAAISVCTNLAAGISATELDHQEVMENGRKAEGALTTLLTTLVQDLP